MNQQNGNLYQACEAVRIFLLRDCPRELGCNSRIYQLIQDHNFEVLFKDHDWIAYLSAAGNYNCILDWPISNHLEVIIKAYPTLEGRIGTIGREISK